MSHDLARDYAERACVECGARRLVRRDSLALLCVGCSSRASLAKGRAARRAAMPTIYCKTCGKEVRHHPSQRRRTYCSRECRKGPNCHGQTWRGSDWKSARLEAIRRQPFCAACGQPHSLQVHHIIPWRLTRNNDQQNLIPLCRRHHKKIEYIFAAFELDLGQPVDADDLLIWRSMLQGLIPTAHMERLTDA